FAGHGIDIEAELGGDEHLLAHGGQRFADQLLIGKGAIDLGSVEEGDAPLHRRAYERNHLLPVRGRPIVHAHPHTAETDGGHFQATGAQSSFLHWSLLVLFTSIGGVVPYGASTPLRQVYTMA